MMDEEATALKATRAMVLLGLLFILVGVIPVVLLLFVMKDNKILGFIGGGVIIAGGKAKLKYISANPIIGVGVFIAGGKTKLRYISATLSSAVECSLQGIMSG